MNVGKENIIKLKSFGFALKIIELSQFLIQNKKEFVLSKQILRSGTAIGALVRESEHAESKIDFIHKLAIAQKESNETQYWLELLISSWFADQEVWGNMLSENKEISRILVAIIVSFKKNL